LSKASIFAERSNRQPKSFSLAGHSFPKEIAFMDNQFNTPDENQRMGTSSSSGSTGAGWDNSDSTYSTGGGGARNLKDAASRKAANVRQKVSKYTRDVAQKVDSSRVPVADSLHSTASMVEERGQQFAGAAHSVAGKLRSGADYIRSNDINHMVEDATDSVKRYPAYALGVAAVLGFIIGRLARRS
jgi:ElaB/YqjD/DUF883 family membrane-anchored ribosome-binding protein